MPDGPRQALFGYEKLYEITRDGRVWNRKLGRFIESPKLSLAGKPQIRFRVGGREVRLRVWQTVVQSWLNADETQELRRAVPPSALGNLAELEARKSAISAAAKRFELPRDIVFKFLLKASSS